VLFFNYVPLIFSSGIGRNIVEKVVAWKNAAGVGLANTPPPSLFPWILKQLMIVKTISSC
jgi:hypothetical protein